MTAKTLHKFDSLAFQTHLLDWYKKNKRQLPWRKTNDPYKIWVSEIMLQQTKVDTVIPYYENFMQRYPTIYDLAEAEEQTVLKDWEGLGYYSRARNLLEAAREVVANYGGKVPDDPKELGELKGIGPYTKGAILSIAFQQAEPAVDGNVMRVLSRVLAVKDNISDQKTRKKFEKIVREIMPERDPSSFNQGLMELGALVCTPKSPACLLCPVQEECRAFHEGIQETLPVKLKQKKQRTVFYDVLLLKDESGKIAIEQRPNNGLLANMWQFPMIEKSTREELVQAVRKKYGIRIEEGIERGHVRHVFSHKIWDLTVLEATAMKSADDARESALRFISPKELDTYPFSVSHLKIKELLKSG